MRTLTVIMMILAFATLGCVSKEANSGDDQANAEAAGTAEQGTAENGASAYEPGSWITDNALALQYSAELKRPVLMNFTGSDWCSWCKKLSAEVFTQDAFLDYAKANLVLLKVDFPQRTKLSREQEAANQKLAEKFGVQGFPTIVLVDDKGEEITRTGYQYGGAEAYVKHLKELLGQK